MTIEGSPDSPESYRRARMAEKSLVAEAKAWRPWKKTFEWPQKFSNKLT